MRRGPLPAALGTVTVSTPSRNSAVMSSATHGAGQREAAMERAMAALHAVVPLARDVWLAPRALQRELSVVKPDVDVFASRGPAARPRQ